MNEPTETTTPLVPTSHNGNAVALLAPANFDLAQRMAKAISASDLVPQQFKNNIPNCLIALEMASRMGASPMAVMQNLYVVHGKPAWSSQFVIAAVNSTGRFSPLRFEMSEDKQRCVAWAVELSTKERLEGPPVTIEMARKEGWLEKNGSKWKTMPELMLRYRAASFFGRLYAPEVLMGMKEESEVIDVQAETVPPIAEPVGLPPVNVECDGNHAEPPCDDPQCWLRKPAPGTRGRKPKGPPKQPPQPLNPPTSQPSAIKQITSKLQESGFTPEQMVRVAIINNWADTTVKELSEIEEPKLRMFLDNWEDTLAELELHGREKKEAGPFE